jgi:hypothetical protein
MKCTKCHCVLLVDNGVPTCETCLESNSKTTSDSVFHSENPKLVHNELLTYVQNHYSTATHDNLRQVVCDFYHPREVNVAKELIWSECQDILAPIERRRNTNIRTKKEAETNDIINAFKKIRFTRA